jgi:hypothetical protein
MSSRERRILIAVIVAGVVLRVLHIATSMGSADSVTWMRNVIATERFGILGAYLHDPGLNHPPLGLALARWTSETGALIGLQFHDAFRLLQTLADVVTTLALARLGLWAAGAFVLSPASIFITGFHCQSDPLMTMFLVLAITLRNPIATGVMIGVAAGIKIIALVAFPLILLRFRGRDLVRYSVAAAAVLTLVFAPAVLATGWVVLRNVFGYTGLTVSWGLNYVLPLTPEARRVVTFALLALLALLWFWQLRRRGRDTERVVGIALLLVLVLAPGFGVQYLFWPLPFLALLLRRWEAVAMHAILSAFLFAMYTAWSGGWPWWFGVHSAGVAGVQWAVGVWVALAAALAISLQRLRAA